MALNLFNTTLIPKGKIIYIYDLINNIIAPGNRAFLSPTIEKVIDEVMDEQLPDNWRSNEAFRKSLSEDFRKKKFSTYDVDHFPAFYAGYYLPNNFYKIQLMMLELFRLGEISFSESKIRILDIGSSVGTTTWALLDLYEILVNVLSLYGLKKDKLPILEIDCLEISQKNLDLYNLIKGKLTDRSEKIIVNDPIQGDVLKSGLDSVNLKKYNIIFASNLICEFPTYKHQKDFASKIVKGLKRSANFVIIETAFLKDTRNLKKIQYELSIDHDITVISPCGRINGVSKKCNNCWSFRRENLIMPDTMKLFSPFADLEDDNEKLKWSYTIFSNRKQKEFPKRNKDHTTLTEAIEKADQVISVDVEIVSGKIYDERDKEHYYLKICDQTEDIEKIILKIPKYYELPRYHFGDLFQIENAVVERIEWDKPKTITYAIFVDPQKTTVINTSELSEPKGLQSFNNIEEENLRYFLKRFFGYDEFTPGQFDILQRVLANENVLGILATGGGKSLTFQLPALLKPGVSLIISPLKSLMDDQVYGLQKRFGFDFVDRIHSGMPYHEKRQVINRFKQGYLKILYIAPERLQQRSFQKELSNLIKRGINISYFPIDEAHCISEWGHDFRPSYAKLKQRQEALSHIDGLNPSIIALTATASQVVQKDILDLLQMKRKEHLIHNIIDRKELSLEVIPLRFSPMDHSFSISYRDPQNVHDHIDHSFPASSRREDVLLFVLKNVLPKRFSKFNISKDAGLIFTIYADPMPAEDIVKNDLEKIGLDPSSKGYKASYENSLNEFVNSDKCREREGANWLSMFLNDNGINSKPWFASPGYRKEQKQDEKQIIEKEWEFTKSKTQEDFIENEINLLVSTKGFGMGIDKPNIRYIIHFGFPGSLESYFQQIGRAGRDRKHAHCILLWDGPTSQCTKYLDSLSSEYKIPECFANINDNNKHEYGECPYQRLYKCDYAKQIYFIESGYPSIQELQAAINSLTERARNEKTFPHVYLKKNYLAQDVSFKIASKRHEGASEKLLIETLYTLNYISDYSQTYLAVKIGRSSSWRDIYNSTNNEVIRQHIDLLNERLIKDHPKFMDTIPRKELKFDIKEHVLILKKYLNKKVEIEEFVDFLNILKERDDVDISYDYRKDYGYEIKLNEKMLKTKLDPNDDLKKVNAWKRSQYEMLEHIMKYAELLPFDNKNSSRSKCRRVMIMQVFGSKGGSDTVRCDFCDNCGYNNSWETQANDIDADMSEQIFISELREFYLNQKNNINYIENNLKVLFNLIDLMIEENYLSLAETISDSWLEELEESENPATNLILAVINLRYGDLSKFNSRFKIFLKATNNKVLIQKTLLNLKNITEIDLKDLLDEQLYNKNLKVMKDNLHIFDSNIDGSFLNIETEIGLGIMKKLTSELSRIYKSYNKGRI
jgi:superfamily II DNA helicase RecQ